MLVKRPTRRSALCPASLLARWWNHFDGSVQCRKGRRWLLRFCRDACFCALGSGSQVLYGPGDGISQVAPCSQRPVGIAQKLPREDGNVGLAGADDVVSLRWSRDHSHRTRQDFRFVTNSLCKGCLISRADGNACRRHVSAGGTIDQVHTGIFQAPGKLHGFVKGPSTFHPIGRRNAHE